MFCTGFSEVDKFQSTSPVWRTTVVAVLPRRGDVISIHVPRVEDDIHLTVLRAVIRISIHVPRVEDDSGLG